MPSAFALVIAWDSLLTLQKTDPTTHQGYHTPTSSTCTKPGVQALCPLAGKSVFCSSYLVDLYNLNEHSSPPQPFLLRSKAAQGKQFANWVGKDMGANVSTPNGRSSWGVEENHNRHIKCCLSKLGQYLLHKQRSWAAYSVWQETSPRNEVGSILL